RVAAALPVAAVVAARGPIAPMRLRAVLVRSRQQQSATAEVGSCADHRLRQPGADALAGHLDETQRGHLGDLMLRPVAAEAFDEAAHHEIAIGLEHHVDEVDDDDPADVTQAQLSDDLLGGFEVVAGHGLLEVPRSEEHTSELQSRFDLVCRLLLENKNNGNKRMMSGPLAGLPRVSLLPFILRSSRAPPPPLHHALPLHAALPISRSRLDSRTMSMKSTTMIPPMSRRRNCRMTSSAASRLLRVTVSSSFPPEPVNLPVLTSTTVIASVRSMTSDPPEGRLTVRCSA